EESDLLNRLTRAGYRGVWVGTARVRHHVPAERLSASYLRRWFHGAGRTDVRLGRFQGCKHLWGAPRWVLRRYAQARLKAWCYAPFKGPRWFRAFRDAAYLRGVIDGSRAAGREECNRHAEASVR